MPPWVCNILGNHAGKRAYLRVMKGNPAGKRASSLGMKGRSCWEESLPGYERRRDTLYIPPWYHGGHTTPRVYHPVHPPGYTSRTSARLCYTADHGGRAGLPRLDGGLPNRQLLTAELPSRVLPLPVSLLVDERDPVAKRTHPKVIPYG